MMECRLNEGQRRFAEEYHSVLEDFLKRRGLSTDDYYDVIVFRFLEAVKQYDECENLRRYEFLDIANSLMRSALRDYRRQEQQKRAEITVLSLDYKLRNSNLTLGDVVADINVNICDEVCEKLSHTNEGYDDAMIELVASIKAVGVLVPLIVRKMDNGLYEIISGHRRKRACQLAGIDNIPVDIRELDDAQAAILLVDSNLQRENLLPSEKAYAYRLKLDAIRHRGKKTDLPGLIEKGESSDYVGLSDAKSGRQIRRYCSTCI